MSKIDGKTFTGLLQSKIDGKTFTGLLQSNFDGETKFAGKTCVSSLSQATGTFTVKN
jgi:hypothetical protein